MDLYHKSTCLKLWKLRQTAIDKIIEKNRLMKQDNPEKKNLSKF